MVVKLNVYDLTKWNLFGAYHSGVEICGSEWSYGSLPDEGANQSGVWRCLPRTAGDCCSDANMGFKTRLVIAEVVTTRAEVRAALNQIRHSDEWKAGRYDLLNHNCNSFSDALCKLLTQGKGIPPWVNRLAGIGNSVNNFFGSINLTFGGSKSMASISGGPPGAANDMSPEKMLMDAVIGQYSPDKHRSNMTESIDDTPSKTRKAREASAKTPRGTIRLVTESASTPVLDKNPVNRLIAEEGFSSPRFATPRKDVASMLREEAAASTPGTPGTPGQTWLNMTPEPTPQKQARCETPERLRGNDEVKLAKSMHHKRMLELRGISSPGTPQRSTPQSLQKSIFVTPGSPGRSPGAGRFSPATVLAAQDSPIKFLTPPNTPVQILCTPPGTPTSPGIFSPSAA